MRKMNNVLMAGAVASAASLGMCTDASAQSSAVQWTTASGGNGHWYRFNPTHVNWAVARSAAIAVGGDLACIGSQSENTFVRYLIPTGDAGYLGAIRTSIGSTGWQWVSGDEWNYTNWNAGEPNGATVGEVVWIDSDSGGWNDHAQANSIQGSIIEYSADCNSDGIVDYGQILSGQLIDANGDGIPDICEVDPCPGDISGNHAVDGVDLAALLGTWGTNGQGEFDCDIDNDGIVGGTDLTIILGGWGPCPPPVLPWATVLEQNVNPAVVTDATLRNAIIASGLPWRVRDNGTNIEMLLVPGGTFMMGCSASTAFGCASDENPKHQVTLTNAFYMGKTEVTQAQWQATMGENPSYFQPPIYTLDTNRPVEQISWNTIQDFNTSTGLRLPTEAEWEYAYRARTTTTFHSFPGYPNGTNDDTLLTNIAWYDGNSGGQPHPVGGKYANALGLHDMSGNIWEWCQDWYGSTYYTSSPAANPTGPMTGSARMFRGGNWGKPSNESRASKRDFFAPNSIAWGYGFGFRVARNP